MFGVDLGRSFGVGGHSWLGNGHEVQNHDDMKPSLYNEGAKKMSKLTNSDQIWIRKHLDHG